jgi:hypothetical protein
MDQNSQGGGTAAEVGCFSPLCSCQKLPTTIREAAFEVMEDAYMKASANGKYPALARQIMYAARPEILERTGEDKLDSQYFTQTLLPDYMQEYDCSDWDVAYDARGHLHEPHTKNEIALGTLEVRKYLQDCRRHGQRVELNAFTSDELLSWIEGKLNQHGIEKVIPDSNVLKAAYRRALEIALVRSRIGEITERMCRLSPPIGL